MAWEYMMCSVNQIDISQLNWLGSQGWELVTVLPPSVCFLKRPVHAAKALQDWQGMTSFNLQQFMQEEKEE